MDENIPVRTVRWLEDQGHTVLEDRYPPLKGADDEVLWAKTQSERALLISTDKGFASRWAEIHYGVLVIRLRQPNRQKIHERVVVALQERRTEESWRGVTCIMRDRVRSTRRAPGAPEEGKA